MRLFKTSIMLILLLQCMILYADDEKKIGKMGKTVPELIQLLKTGKESQLGFYILDLGMSDDERAIQPLEEVLMNSKYKARTRAEAAEAFGLLRNKKAIPILKKLLDSKGIDSQIRLKAATSLFIIGEKELAYSYLNEIARDGEAEALSPLAIWDNHGNFVIHDIQGREILLKALNYTDDEVKAKAAVMLSSAHLYETEVYSAIESALRKIPIENPEKAHKDSRILIYVVKTLGNIGNEKAISKLKELELLLPSSSYEKTEVRKILNQLTEK